MLCSQTGEFQCFFFFAKELTHSSQEDETKPEDCIPDVPDNEHARELLVHEPTKGLWMPLWKEVKVMQCERGRVSSNTLNTHKL